MSEQIKSQIDGNTQSIHLSGRVDASDEQLVHLIPAVYTLMF